MVCFYFRQSVSYPLIAKSAVALPGPMDLDAFSLRLWGNIYFSPSTRRFSRSSSPGSRRTFEHFILDPLYKLYSQVLGEDTESLKATLGTLGISLKPKMFEMDVRPLLKLVLNQFFGTASGLVDMIVEGCPDPKEGAKLKVPSIPSSLLAGT